MVVFYDSKARSATAYDRRIDGNVAEFSVTEAGGDQVFKDSVTGSLWNVEGRAVSGAQSGKASLTQIAGGRSRWFAWSATFPKSTIFRPSNSKAK